MSNINLKGVLDFGHSPPNPSAQNPKQKNKIKILF